MTFEVFSDFDDFVKCISIIKRNKVFFTKQMNFRMLIERSKVANFGVTSEFCETFFYKTLLKKKKKDYKAISLFSHENYCRTV